MHCQKLGHSIRHIHPNYVLFEFQAIRGRFQQMSCVFPQNSLFTRKLKNLFEFVKKIFSLFFLFQKSWKRTSPSPHLTCRMFSLWELRCPNQGEKRTKKREREEKLVYTGREEEDYLEETRK